MMTQEQRDSHKEYAQIGVSDEYFESIDKFVDEYFVNEQSLYRFCITYALQKNLDYTKFTREQCGNHNKYSVSGIDPDGSLKTIIELLTDDHHLGPYALAEQLANAGMHDFIENNYTIPWEEIFEK